MKEQMAAEEGLLFATLISVISSYQGEVQPNTLQDGGSRSPSRLEEMLGPSVCKAHRPLPISQYARLTCAPASSDSNRCEKLQQA